MCEDANDAFNPIGSVCLREDVVVTDSQLIIQKLDSSKFALFRKLEVPAAIGLSFPVVYLPLKSL